jgi:hypothetical protein
MFMHDHQEPRVPRTERTVWPGGVLIALAAAAAVAGCSDAPEESKAEKAPARFVADSPLKLLTRVRDLARAGDYDAIEPHVLPATAVMSDPARDLVSGIRSEKPNGEWAYSDASLSAVVERCPNRIQLITPRLHDLVRGELSRRRPELWRILQGQPSRFQVFDFKGADIVMLRTAGEYQLVTWGNLTWLTRRVYAGEASFEARSDVATSRPAKLPWARELALWSLRGALAGDEAVRRAASELGLTAGLTPGNVSSVVRQLTRTIEVSRFRGKLSLRFTHTDAELASRLPELLVKQYLGAESRRITAHLKTVRGELRGEAEAANERFKEAGEQRAAFEKEHPDAVKVAALAPRLQKLQGELIELRRRQTAAGQEIAQLKLKMPSTTTRPLGVEEIEQPNPQLAQMKERLRRYKERLDSLVVSGMTEKHPTIVDLRARIELLEKRIPEIPPTVLVKVVETLRDPDAEDVEPPSPELIQRMAEVRKEFDHVSEQIERLEPVFTKYHRIWVAAEKLRNEYGPVLRAFEEAREEAATWRGRLATVEADLAAEPRRRGAALDAVESGGEAQLIEGCEAAG